jgi:hypothetical protein
MLYITFERIYFIKILLHDLHTFIEELSNGVIYFSTGSKLRLEGVPRTILQTEAQSSVEVGDLIITGTAEQFKSGQMASTVSSYHCIGWHVTTIYVNFT